MSTHDPVRRSIPTWALRVLGWAGGCLVLLAVLELYQRPDFLLQLADQLWSCF